MNALIASSARQDEFRKFVEEYVIPYAAEHDRSGRFSDHIIPCLSERGYLAPFLEKAWGGESMDMLTLGALHEEVGRACSSVRSLLTVHGMAAYSINRWGNDELRDKWLLPLTKGEKIGALAVSEPNAGSDITGVETIASPKGDGFILNGRKKWMTCGQIADVFILLAKSEGKLTAFALDRDLSGLTITPMTGITGTRGSMLAELLFEDCFIHKANLLARPGFGNVVALSALGFGRFSVANGSVGIIQACLDASLEYSNKIHRSGSTLRDHQLIQHLITDMVTDVNASRLLCRSAAAMVDSKDEQEVQQVFMAKYYASTAAMRVANNAAQIHGANGCSEDYPVERYMRDAKVMEIIEGSTQIQQIAIADMEFQKFDRRTRMSSII